MGKKYEKSIRIFIHMERLNMVHDISIVIPVFNQYNSLLKTLHAFEQQTVSKSNFYIIIIDDGSTDELTDILECELQEKFNVHLELIHQQNRGRAAARNVGISISDAEIIIFCDGDRFPKQDFIEQHINSHKNGNKIVIGASYDYFGKSATTSSENFDWNYVYRFSRLPSYYKKISKIYTPQGDTQSNLAWMSLLVGNSSIRKDLLLKVSGFNEKIVEWGFEHFELALRLQNLNYPFFLNRNAINYHVPHPRKPGFYNEMIKKNLEDFSIMYPFVNISIVEKLLKLEIDISQAENMIFY